jgi:hypothetical protein
MDRQLPDYSMYHVQQIDLSTIFGVLPREVSPADALGNRACGLEREVKGLVGDTGNAQW